MRTIRMYALAPSILLAPLLAGCGASAYPGGAPMASLAHEAAMAPPPPSAVAEEASPEARGTETFEDYGVNPFVEASKDRLSTFAVDVDTASYTFARRRILEGELPPRAAVRAEEFLNYFDYGYEPPEGGPFAIHAHAAPSPFTKGRHVVRIALQAKKLDAASRSPVHLTYLVDTSGSMDGPDRIELAKKSLKMLTGTLREGDTVALCTYAGGVREVLPPTDASSKGRILAAVDELSAGGSTAMASGIDLAYELAARSFKKGHVNRVIVLSDGDANVGPRSHEEILRLIEDKRRLGITLSTVGFGTGNYKDTTMEQLANKGDGNYFYVDDERQASRVFVEQSVSTLEVVARDVKVQVEFDPEVVEKYRLVGYENRDVKDRDFRNDKVDGGEIGAGHSVTALYEVVLRREDRSPVTVRVRHKAPGDAPGEGKAAELVRIMEPAAIAKRFEDAPATLRFATAVAGFAEILRQSPHLEGKGLRDVEALARSAAPGASIASDGEELVALVRQAAALRGEADAKAVAGVR